MADLAVYAYEKGYAAPTFTALPATASETLNVSSIAPPPSAGGVPTAPSGISNIGEGNAIRLTWTDNSANETIFRLQRANDADFTDTVVTWNLPLNTETYLDTTITNGQIHWHRVRAENVSGASAWNTVSAGLAVNWETPTGDHAYFEALLALPQLYTSSSLRDWTDTVAHMRPSLTTWLADHPEAGGVLYAITYDPENDTYLHAQDGTKFIFPMGADGTLNPAGTYEGPRLRWDLTGIASYDPSPVTCIITMDTWYGPEWEYGSPNMVGFTNLKFYSSRSRGDKRYVTHVKFYNVDAVDKAFWIDESPDWGDALTMIGQSTLPGFTRRETPMLPRGLDASGYQVAAPKIGTWVRQWIVWEIGVPWDDGRLDGWRTLTGADMSIASRWNLWSHWWATSTQGPVREIYRVPHLYIDLNSFYFTHGTSNDGPSDFVNLYHRNLVVLKNYHLATHDSPEDDTTLFQRPSD